MNAKIFKLTYEDGVCDPTTCFEMDVVDMCPVADEDAVLALEVGQSHTDLDGDTWERIA
jgi:hypothetical protein